MTHISTSPNTSTELVEFIARRAAELAAEIIVTRLRQEPGIGAPRYATADSNPLNSRRAFLNAHRAKCFPTLKQGRNVAALWSDMLWDPCCMTQELVLAGGISGGVIMWLMLRGVPPEPHQRETLPVRAPMANIVSSHESTPAPSTYSLWPEASRVVGLRGVAANWRLHAPRSEDARHGERLGYGMSRISEVTECAEVYMEASWATE